MIIRVIGYTWEGYECSYEYITEKPILTHSEASEWLDTYAGDFQKILDFCVCKNGEVILDWMVPGNDEKFFKSRMGDFDE